MGKGETVRRNGLGVNNLPSECVYLLWMAMQRFQGVIGVCAVRVGVWCVCSVCVREREAAVCVAVKGQHLKDKLWPYAPFLVDLCRGGGGGGGRGAYPGTKPKPL